MTQERLEPTDKRTLANRTNFERKIDTQTITDFGVQWKIYTDNSGFYGSVELMGDIFGPLLALDDVRGKRVADVGSGTGRIVNMLLDAGAFHVTAIEPSDAFDVLRTNVESRAESVTLIRGRGEDIPLNTPFDLVTSIGVLHHVVDPGPIVRAALSALKPGGRMIVWLYAREGNERYLLAVKPLRHITSRLPHTLLAMCCSVGDAILMSYIAVARFSGNWLRPSNYLVNIYGRLAADKRRLIIYDQLNPLYAHYYTRDEALALMLDNGFESVRIHHRHGYSWIVIGERAT